MTVSLSIEFDIQSPGIVSGGADYRTTCSCTALPRGADPCNRQNLQGLTCSSRFVTAGRKVRRAFPKSPAATLAMRQLFLVSTSHTLRCSFYAASTRISL